MESPQDEIRRRVVDELLELYADFGDVVAAEEHRRVIPIAHGWYQQARRSTQAMRTLQQGDLNHEAAPLRRLLFELAVGLQWLTEATDAAVDALLHNWHSNRERLRRAVEESAWTDDPQILAAGQPLDVDPSTAAEDRYLAFRHQCERLGRESWYVMWLLETSQSHATAALAESYLSDDETNGIILIKNPWKPSPSADNLGAALLLAATAAFNSLLRDKPWTEVLTRLESELRTTISSPTPASGD